MVDNKNAANNDAIANYKLVMLGEAGVGKTCLVNRYIKGAYTQAESTIGSNYFSNVETVKPQGVAQPVKVKL
jgi:GTPase SAR1 family protein